MHLSRRPVRRLLTALALTAAAAAPAGVAAAEPAPAAAPSSGWNDFSCKPSAAHPRPVVLVHGTLSNKTDSWTGLAPYLVDRGYCVFSLDYGQLPIVPFFYGLDSAEKSAHQLADYVDEVLAATGTSKVDMVGHSQGGVMPRWYLKFLGGAAKVNTLVGLAPNNHGTTISGIGTVIQSVPGAEKLLGALTPGLTDMLNGSDFLTRLNEGGDTVPGVHYTVISTKYDEAVTPYQGQALNGPDVHNVVVQDLCPSDISIHRTLLINDTVARHETANALDPAHATPTTCDSD